MNLIKSSLLNAIAVVIKMLTLLGINKVIAIYVGPAGYAVIGQLQNSIQMLLAISGGALNTGVTKYTAEYGNDKNKQKQLWSTAFKINFYLSLTVCILLIIFHKLLSFYFFDSYDYENVFLWFAATVLLFVLNSFFLAIINGKKETFLYVKINIIGSLVSLVVTGLAAFYFGLYGALVALVSNQSIVFFVTLIMCRKLSWFNYSAFKERISKKEGIKLSKFALLALVSAIVIPTSHILVRNHLTMDFGWENAGYWDAMWKISSIYLMFVTMTLKVYYLPRLSEIKCPSEMRAEIVNGYKVIIPILILISTSIYFLRDIVIQLLFTKEFSSMSDLFAWQLIGDTVKISSWLLGYVLLGKAMIKLAVISEVIFGFCFYFLVLLMTKFSGLEGTVQAHALNYTLYFLYMAILLKRSKVI